MDDRHPGRRRTRGLSRILFLHILQEFSIVLGCCVLAFLTLFLISSLFDDLEDLLKYQAGVGDIVRYFLLLQAPHVVDVVPMSVLLASMYTVANLCRHNEMSALSAAGLSLTAVSLPIWLLSIILAGVQMFIAEHAAPKAQAAAEQVLAAVADPYENRQDSRRSHLAFHDRDGHRDWLFEDFAVDGPSRGIIVTQYRDDGTVEWELRADTAEFLNGTWMFSGASVSHFDSEGLQLSEPVQHHADAFRHPDLTQEPKRFLYTFRLRPAAELNIPALYKLLHDRDNPLSGSTRAVLSTYFYHRIFYPFACLIGGLLGLPLAVTRERRTPMASFGLAASLMVLYYVMMQFLLLLGKNQVVPPVVAGSLPFLLFAGWGCWEMHRKR